MTKIVGRTRARVQAIQLLFQAQVQGLDVFDLLRGGTFALEDGPVDPFAEELARGVAVNRLAIERMLDNISTCWSYSRMPLVDRTIMSVALFEMFMQDDTPTSVAISEAVEISKLYGGDDSSNFVNGILGDVARLAEETPGVSLAALANRVAETAAAQEAASCSDDSEATESAQEHADEDDDLDALGADLDDEAAQAPADIAEQADSQVVCETEGLTVADVAENAEQDGGLE